MPRIPAPKFPKRAHQSFNIGDASQLMRKLTVEIHQFAKHNSSSTISGYLALNIAMTAWHMVDWVDADMDEDQCDTASRYLGQPLSNHKSFVVAVTTACTALRICQVIATAGKHAEVKDRPDPSLSTRFKLVKSDPNKAGLPGEGLSYIWVIKRSGEEYLAEEIFKKVHRFWEDLLTHLSMIEDPIMGRGWRGW
jgi:hypothetical protein